MRRLQLEHGQAGAFGSKARMNTAGRVVIAGLLISFAGLLTRNTSVSSEISILNRVVQVVDFVIRCVTEGLE